MFNDFDGISEVFDISTDVYYTMEKHHSMEDTDMSFVGVGIVDGKMIGFADSKLTKQHGDKRVESTDTPQVKKLFWNDKFMIAFAGTYDFIIDAGNARKKTITIAELVEDQMEMVGSPVDLCYIIFSYLHENCILDTRPTTAIAVYSVNGVKFLMKASIASNKIEVNTTSELKCNYYYAGVEFYRDYVAGHLEKILTTDKEALRTELDGIIKRFEEDHPREYNAVGNGWLIHILGE